MMLSEDDRNALKKKFAMRMKDDVTLVLFVDGRSPVSKDLVEFSQLIAEFSPKMRVEVEDSEGGRNQRMRDMKVEHTPCMVPVKGDFSRLRYFGVPEGYEMPAVTDAIVELSGSPYPLSPKAEAALSAVKRKANIKVFVLHTCPFCPSVVRHAYRAAMGSPKVTAEIIDSSVFTDLAVRHSVMGVPKIVLNDSTDVTGAVQEVQFFEKLREADLALLDSMYA